MRKYGLRIGDVGVEFETREERQKALLTFTEGACVNINGSGIVYVNSKGVFSTYERNDNDILVNCSSCYAIFNIEVCQKRDYPNKNSWEAEYGVMSGHICDGCLEIKRKEKAIIDARTPSKS